MDKRSGTLEGVDMKRNDWKGRRVFVTGHTGFKGGWLSLWLAEAGAEVHGYSLQPPTQPSLFVEARVLDSMAGHTIGDVRDFESLRTALQAADPDVIFHLAAQPLVRRSYADPVETMMANVMGTAHLLQAARGCKDLLAIINVTSDKCYHNREWLWGYREDEALGGHDPYSASKACSELVTAAWRASFLDQKGVAVASGRAGNVIGGGDWAEDRLLPDFFRAWDAGQALVVRRPNAVRPWQHVLEPVSGYLVLAEALMRREPMSGAWNFGPEDRDAQPVASVLDKLCQVVPLGRWTHQPDGGPHEAGLLKLDCSKARNQLGWRPRWTLDRALRETAHWHMRWREGHDARSLTIAQIEAYEGS